MGEKPKAAVLPLSDTDVETYRAIAAGEGSNDTDSIKRLTELGLVDDSPHDRGPVALDPRTAAQRLLAAERALMAQAVDRMARIPVIEQLALHFDPNRMYGGPGSEFLPSRHLMNVRIGQVLDDVRSELLTSQPGAPADRDPDVYGEGVARARRLLSRGVTVRTLYSAGALRHPATCGYVEAMIAEGGEVRVGRVLPPRLVLADRRNLFINNHVIPDSETDCGWQVTDLAAVAWTRVSFTAYWDMSTPWQQARRAVDGAVTNERQRKILRELDAGYPQQQVGLRVNLSERAVNKELAALRAKLSMRSTYQLMSWWGRSEERDLP